MVHLEPSVKKIYASNIPTSSYHFAATDALVWHDNLNEQGLRISYDTVLDISTELGNTICHHYYRMKKAICLPELKGCPFKGDWT